MHGFTITVHAGDEESNHLSNNDLEIVISFLHLQVAQAMDDSVTDQVPIYYLEDNHLYS